MTDDPIFRKRQLIMKAMGRSLTDDEKKELGHLLMTAKEPDDD